MHDTLHDHVTDTHALEIKFRRPCFLPFVVTLMVETRQTRKPSAKAKVAAAAAAITPARPATKRRRGRPPKNRSPDKKVSTYLRSYFTFVAHLLCHQVGEEEPPAYVETSPDAPAKAAKKVSSPSPLLSPLLMFRSRGTRRKRLPRPRSNKPPVNSRIPQCTQMARGGTRRNS